MGIKVVQTDYMQQVCNFISLTIPSVVPDNSKWYTIKAHGTYKIRIAKPDPFDCYDDVIARITLYKQDRVLCDYLITHSTDLNKLCAKLSTKIKEARYL